MTILVVTTGLTTVNNTFFTLPNVALVVCQPQGENGRSIFVAPSGLLYVDWFFEDDNSCGDHGVDHSAVYNAFILPNVASVVCHLQSENGRSNFVAPLGLQYVNRLD